MSSSLIDFESTRVRDEKRLEAQQARKLMLEKVRKQHESAQQQKVAAVHRGETTWLLPSVEAAIQQQGGGKAYKPKKDKKHKKKMKKEKKKKAKRESPTSSDSSSGEEWVEKTSSGTAAASLAPATAAPAPPQEKEPSVQREGWMEMSSLFGTFTRNELREREGNSRVLANINKKNKAPDKPGSHALELNPYYRDGGSGLPQDEEASAVAPPQPAVGPSAEWLRKALKRAKEQADEDKLPLEQILENRWGSLSNFYELLETAEKRERDARALPRMREMRRPGDSCGRQRSNQTPELGVGMSDTSDDRKWRASRRGSEDTSRSAGGRDGTNRSNAGGRDDEPCVSNRTDNSHSRHTRNGDNDIRRDNFYKRTKRRRRSSSDSSSGNSDSNYTILSRKKSPKSKEKQRERRSAGSKDGKWERGTRSRSGSTGRRSSKSSNSSSEENSGPGRRDNQTVRPCRQSNSRSRRSNSRCRRSNSRSRRSNSRSRRSNSRSRRSNSRSRRSNSRSRRSYSRDRRSNSRDRRSNSRDRRSHNRDRLPKQERSASGRRSPEKNPRRLLKPADDDAEGHSGSPASHSAKDCAVWENSRILPSSHAPRGGGWRKRPQQQQIDEPSQRSSSGRSHSSSVNDKNSTSSKRASPPSPRQTAAASPPPSARQTAAASPPPSARQTAAKPTKIPTEQELNQLGAKIVKAELLGNEALAAKFKKKLEKARNEYEAAVKAGQSPAEGGGVRTEEVVLLTTTNARGLTRPVATSDREAPSSSSKKSRSKLKPSACLGADGLRDKYFPDDNRTSLANMFEKEKLGGTDQSDALFVRAAARAHVSTLDDDYTLDDSFVDKSVGREDTAGQDARDRMKAIMEHQRREKALASCHHCCDSGLLQKHLIVSLGHKSYVCLPSHQSLVEGHCLVVPREHTATSTLLDEDTWQEMKSYRQSLVRLFSSRGEDVLFLECCMRLNCHPHTVLHCIPLPRDMGDLAPIYYKKAIQESEGEWSQNVKLVDLRGRDVRKAIPRGFPYFSVDFGAQPGYAHVIEDEQSFPSFFGQSVVGGMLDIEPQLWRKPRLEKFDEHRRKVLAFAKDYDQFDPMQPDT